MLQVPAGQASKLLASAEKQASRSPSPKPHLPQGCCRRLEGTLSEVEDTVNLAIYKGTVVQRAHLRGNWDRYPEPIRQSSRPMPSADRVRLLAVDAPACGIFRSLHQ